MIAIDTNLLVHAQRRHTPEHRAARRAIERASADRRGWGIPLSCIAEFWCVVTHPASSGGPSPAKEARGFLHELMANGGANVWTPGTGFWERLTQLASDMKIAGARVFDLQIALIALENGATEVWSHDRGFAVLPGLVVRDPL
ncbi:MAG TPA: TA system VapC family ribonuclease toxin [Terriglobia bacterium]|nr:TA system VapC family ribonuclease toxin [Terriglobia bacterium]